jgi:glycine/D-amino acid oxidase-like deaminating enzyme
VPVTFCTDGGPMAGPVDDGPGLWVFTGFSAAFSLVPPAAEWLADAID